MTRPEWRLLFWVTWVMLATVTGALCLALPRIAHAEPRHGTASWYSVASCQREGTSGIMANGRSLDDEAFTAASLDYSFGTALRVCRANKGKGRAPHCAVVEVTDRGPARRLYRQGRIIDLSKAAFAALAPLAQGRVQVTVESQP